MGRLLAAAACELGCSERTLRRYINGGLLRGRRVVRGELELSQEEVAYLAGHWTLLSSLMEALRTEREVRLAVLFGSTATGEDSPVSDVDLLIVQGHSDWSAQASLNRRLRRALGRSVDLVALEQARVQPALLADVVRDGRVLVNRDGLWAELCLRRAEIDVAAGHEEALSAAGARATIVAARERLATL